MAESKYLAISNPNQPHIDRIFEQIDTLLEQAQKLDVDPLRVTLAMKYFSGKYGTS